MNSYDRYMGVLRGEAVDCLPRLPILMAFAARFIGSNYRAFASDHRVLVEANKRCVEAFGFDQLSAISDPYRETHAFGAEIVYPEDDVPQCVAPPLAETKDLSTLKTPDPRSSARMLDRVVAVDELRGYAGQRYSVLGWVEGPAAEAADLRGVTSFLEDLLVDSAFACALMDQCVAVGIEFAREQVKAGADTIGVGDAVVSQVSPRVYSEMIFAREKALIDGIHAAGGLVRLHICGDITHLLRMVARLGADIVDLDWAVSMSEARRILGPRATLCGNLDPVGAVMHSTPERIAEEVREVYATVGNPYMVGAGCEVPRDTPVENLRALCGEVRWE